MRLRLPYEYFHKRAKLASGLRTADSANSDCDCGWLTDEWTTEFPWAPHEARQLVNSKTEKLKTQILGSSRIHGNTDTMTHLQAAFPARNVPPKTRLRIHTRSTPTPTPLLGSCCRASTATSAARMLHSKWAAAQSLKRSPSRPLTHSKANQKRMATNERSTVSQLLTARQSGL